jgi:hypothetical protein
VKVISYILLTIFSVMLIVLIPIATVLFSLNSTILKPYNTEKYIAQSGLNSNVKQMIRDKVTGEDKNQQPTALQKVQIKLVGQAFDLVVTDELVTNKLGVLETSFWDYMTDKSDTFLHVPIAEISDMTAKFPTLKIGELGNMDTLIGLKADKLEEIKKYYNFYSKGILGMYVLIVILVVIGVLLSYVLNIGGMWLGSVLMVGGVIAMLVWVPAWLITFYKIDYSTSMKSLGSGLTELILNARHDFLQCLTITAVVVIALGILTMFMKKREQAPEAPPENNEMITIA